MKEGDTYVGKDGKTYVVIRMSYTENAAYAKYAMPPSYVPPTEPTRYLTAVEAEPNENQED